ncbi:MAG TPA: LON peptidase substrate-binding domain-containing protein [Acidimicrobiales bacterium]|nr:LON peptidase substrate-binding domain-containing protein [Acidimicrobiales bacterium]
MTTERLAMFPLGTVLFPGEAIPLQVFEPRYQVLVARCLEGRPEFGIALIERGSEVGGGETRTAAGTIARIVEARELGGGRWFLLVVGDRRIRVERWLDDDPHPWAEVAEWPDPTPGPGVEGLLRSTTTAVRRVLAMATELGQAVRSTTFEVPDDPGPASHRLASVAPLGPFDRQRLLEAPSVEHRLHEVTVACDELRTTLDQAFRS